MGSRIQQIVYWVTLGLAVGLPTLNADQYDIIVRGGRIVDGSGAAWFVADVGIRDGKISKIGRLTGAEAGEQIDAQGKYVAPGFVDMMGQTATPMMQDPNAALNLLTQGITTINAGEGASAAPRSTEEGARAGWTTMAEYFQLLEMAGMPINVVQTIGHTQVRRIVLGDVDRRPSNDELARMQQLVREAMQAGAIGVSTALIYPPAVFATTKEIAALAEVAGEHGGKYYTHMRNEGDLLLEAIDEALDIGRTGNTPVHIFHLKAAGKQNWGKMQLAIAKIKAARAAGQQVTADIYPYVNNGLGIAAFIHPRHFAQGRDRLLAKLADEEFQQQIRHELETTDGWENWFRHAGKDWNRVIIGQAGNARYAKHAGKSVAQIAQALDEDAWTTFFQLVRGGAFALPESMTDANKILAMQQEFVSFCTDVGPAGGSRIASHPRGYGAFPRLLSRYVRNLGAISLERAVAQAAAAACNNVLAFDRGRLAEGLAADVIVFDYEQLADNATFAQPAAVSQGISHVIVNGVTALRDGKLTGARPGQVLRGPGYDPKRAAHQVATGEANERFGSFDRMMRRFMEKHKVPGASLAITDQGRLVYSRGYGYADLATGEQVRPESLFRIASISKPITAVAIMQLVESGKLKLDDKVFEVLGRVADIQPSLQPGLHDITIRHLLEHRGGWDRGQSFDAMFQSVRFARALNRPAPADAATVIDAMFKQPLDFEPGTRYAYSNFGYCLLGRVIEKITGHGYEDYVKQQVLRPLGIETMRIGETRLTGRAVNEVRYYQHGTGRSVFADDLGQDVPWPYGGWHLEAMDAHGGWIASAVDLARFSLLFGPAGNRDVLSAESIATMGRRPPGLAGFDAAGNPKQRFYSLGWINERQADGSNLSSHTGSLNGTATILIRRPDGRNLTVLMNSRVSPHATHLGREIKKLLQETADDLPTE